MPAKPKKPAAGATFVYVGAAKGIHQFRLQTSDLEVSQNITLAPLGLGAELASASFLELDLERRVLFAVSEVEKFEGKPGGSVSAFALDAAGKPQLLNQRPTGGTAPCHLALDGQRRNLLVVNRGGSVAVFPVAADGKLGEARVVALEKNARPQGVAVDPAGRFAFVCDGGLDQLARYQLDAAAGKLGLATAVKVGPGPRHLAFRPDGRFAYLVHEKGSTVTAFAYTAAMGKLAEVQQVSTVPPYFDGPNAPAEIALHPNGKFLYVSNRGHNSVVLFAVDAEKGTLTYVEEQGTGGKKPVHFGIQPSARHMAIVNQDSDTVLASRIDAGNGRLKPSGVFTQVAGPACVKFLPPADGG